MIREAEVIVKLKQRVTEQFGKQIVSAADCEIIAKSLRDNQNVSVSAQTLRRFFGLIKASSKTSLYTLDLLAKYCGFTSFSHFRQSYGNIEIEAFFGSKENSGNDFWRKSEDLCRQISESPEMLVTVHQRLLSYPLARKYFMENHPMRDSLGSIYSQYFLAYLKYNQSNEAKIFAYGFLFQDAFLSQNHELMALYYQKVTETPLTNDIHVIPAGMKFGVELLYADLSQNEELFAQKFEEMKRARLQYIPASARSVCSFEYSVLELLIFTNRTKELKFLVKNQTPQSEQDVAYVPADRKQTHEEVWKILCAVVFLKTNQIDELRSTLDTINLENIGFGWKKYYSVIYYFVLLSIGNKADENAIISELAWLLERTQFPYFENALKNHLSSKTKNTGGKCKQPRFSKP